MLEPQETASQTTARRRRWLIAAALAAVLGLAVCTASVLLTGLFVAQATQRGQPAAAAPTLVAVQPATGQDTDQASQPAVPSEAGRIAFIDADGRLGTVAPDGSDSRLLSRPGWRYQFPAWSPDGARVAATGNDGQQGKVSVFLDEPASMGVELYSSVTQPPFYLYWSPDGRQVSFLANAPSGIGLWLAPADGQSDASLLGTGQPFYWDWASDGASLFIHSNGLGDTARLAYIDTDGEAIGENIANPGLFQAPGISASGRYMAFSEIDGESFRLAVQATEGEARVTAPHLGLAAIGWSPVADQLAFTSPQSSRLSFTGPLRLMDAGSGAVRDLVRETVLSFFWAPDGRSIAYLTQDDRRGNPGAGRPAGMGAPTNQDDHPTIRLRLWVVDVSTGERRLLSTFEPTAIFVNQFIPFFDQYALSHRIWSPASDALVLPMVDADGSEAIFVVPADGAEPQRVAAGSMAFWSRN